MRNGVLLMGGAALRGAALHARRRLEAGRHVLDQRLRDLLAVEPRDDAVLGAARARSIRLVAAPARARRSALALCCTILVITIVREVHSRAAGSRWSITGGLVARLLRRQAPLQPGRAAHPAPRPRAPGARGEAAALYSLRHRDGPAARASSTRASRSPSVFVGRLRRARAARAAHAARACSRATSRASSSSASRSSTPTCSRGPTRSQALEERTRENLAQYERFATALGLPATSAFAIGTEVAVEAEKLGGELSQRYPKALVVAGQIIFEEDTLWNRLLHNETAFLIQRRLQHVGVPMVVLPVELDLSRPMPAVAVAAMVR